MTNMPGGLDTFVDPTSADFLDTPGVVHHVQQANVHAALLAMEKIIVGPVWKNMVGEGCDPTGATDCTAIVQAAADAIKTTGGTLFFPRGIYRLDSLVNLDDHKKGTELVGAGGGNSSFIGATVLRYTAATGTFIRADGAQGLKFRNLSIVYNHATYNGDLTSFQAFGGANAAFVAFEHCYLGGEASSNRTARSLARLGNAQCFSFRDTWFNRCKVGLRLGDGGPSNIIHVERCEFANYNGDGSGGAAIYSHAHQVLTIVSNNFEGGGTSGLVAGAYDQDNVDCYATNFISNWFGDVSSGTWISGLRTLGGLIQGNWIAGTAGITTRGVAGLVILGNRIQVTGTPLNLLTTAFLMSVIGNDFDGSGAVVGISNIAEGIVSGNGAALPDHIYGSDLTGWGTPTGTLSRTTFDQSTVTLPQLAQKVAALITDLKGRGDLAP